MVKTTIFSGGFGSGKSEISMNYARYLRQQAQPVILADLDLVNPYFASREQRERLEAEGICLAAPPDMLRFSDVPALPLEIMKHLQSSFPMVMDLAGDEAGAVVLGSLQSWVRKRGDFAMLLVINPYRPFAENLENMREMVEILQQAAHMEFTGIVSNPNLVEATTPEDILEGHELVQSYAASFGLPIQMLTVERSLMPALQGKIEETLFPLDILLRPDFLKESF